MRQPLRQGAPESGFIGATGVLCLLLACGPTPTVDTTDTPQCLSLSVPQGSDGLVTAAPARISLFFSVDTCAGVPVAGLDASHFEISEDGKAVSPFESQRRVQPKGQNYRMNSVVLLDLSGSVLKSGQFTALKDAAAAYVKRVLGGTDEGQRVAVVTFDGREKVQRLVDFTADANGVLRALNGLEVSECTSNADCVAFSDRRTCAGWRCVDDSTNLNGAVVQGLDALDAQAALEPTIAWKDAALILFTDGTDQASRVQQLDAVERARTSVSHVFAVGLGGEVDEAALRALGKDGYWPARQADQLGDAFEAIASRVTGLANRFYLLEYCSPKRSGKHTLKITATNGSLIGGLSRTFDATGFASGCEL